VAGIALLKPRIDPDQANARHLASDLQRIRLPGRYKMPSESPRIMQQLIRDHRNMSGLLDVLNEELDRYRHTKHVDFEVLSRLIDYILNFPELRHRPREDLIFRCLKQREPSSIQETEGILSEHKELAELTRRLSAAVRNLWQNVEMPRSEFESLVDKYIETYRRHMRQEEEKYFPLALMSLWPSDWAKIEARAALHGEDPLFGGKTDAEYQAFYDRILRLAR
jgi:hemerythrin-like domain-containing protein